MQNLYNNLMNLVNASDAFYFVDQKVGSTVYRVFTYRLASFADFQLVDALECRGHTFNMSVEPPSLVCLPPNKFFNYGEHIGWGTEIDLQDVDYVMDKLDGSLISTVVSDGILLKSKTSFTSQQAGEATDLINSAQHVDFKEKIMQAVNSGHTVNFEFTSPTNQIVIGYNEPRLTVLNVRSNVDGSYWKYDQLVDFFGADNVVKKIEFNTSTAAFIEAVSDMTGVEGVIIKFNNGLMVKHKTNAYAHLHHLKDNVNNPRRLWEACVNELGDDLRASFVDDQISLKKIIAYEELAARTYNEILNIIEAFYAVNKSLDRKSYAILGQQVLPKNGVFSLAMNLFLNKPVDVKGFMIKNYKQFGVSDENRDDENE